MKKDLFISLLSNPEIPDSKVSGQLHDVLMNYPYCQSARMLYVKSLSDQHSILYNDQLKIASAYANDRSILYDLMNKGLKPEEQINFTDTVIEDKQIEADEIAVDVLDELLGSSKDPAVNELSENLNEIVEDNAVEDTIEKSIREVEPIEDNAIVQVDDVVKEKSIENAVVKKEVLSPQEIIRQRLAELGKEDALIEPEPLLEAKKEVKEDIEPVVEADDVELVEIKEELAETEVGNVLQPEILESELVEEDQRDFLDEVEYDEIESDEISDKGEIVEVVESSFSEDIRLKSEVVEQPSSEEYTKANNQTIEEEKIDVPIDFKENEKHTFLSWLKAVDKNAIVEILTVGEEIAEDVSHSEEDEENVLEELEETNDADDTKEDIQSSFQLIEQFIKEDPKIEPGKAQFYSAGNMAKNSIMDNEDVASETLANIYLEQGNHHKAIKMLELLSLKNPKKSPYFAARIKDIKNTNS